MIETWVLLTVAAAFLQNLRSSMQKRLTGELSVNGASYVRFLYALPFAWIYLLAMTRLDAPDTIQANVSFVLYCFVGGIAQVAATGALLASFTTRNFAVGTALSKTETVQAAVFGLIVLGDAITWSMAVGIAISFVGVVLLSVPGGMRQLSFDRALVFGLLAGTGFAVAAVCYRGAALALPEGSTIYRAAFTLAVTLSIQTLAMALYLKLREPGEVAKVWGARRKAWLVGLIGMAASAGWFTAMAMVSAALVRAVGQIELLFTFVTSIWFFRERVGAREIGGALCVLLGILLLV